MTHTRRFLYFIIAATLAALLCRAATVLSADGCGPFSTIPAQSVYSDTWQLLWDPENPSEMAAGTSVRLAVLGGTPNYRWQLEGEGFSITPAGSPGGDTVTLAAAADSCRTAVITVTDGRGDQTGGTVTVDRPALEWDLANSVRTFPDDAAPVTVFVNGGRPPYDWHVSEGFELVCVSDCGTSNTVRSLGTDCVGTITVTDACGTDATGYVRRPGRWIDCGYQPATSCYFSDRCGARDGKVQWFDYHRVRVTCCTHGSDFYTITCDADGWQFTAYPTDCNTPSQSCADYKVWRTSVGYYQCD